MTPISTNVLRAHLGADFECTFLDLVRIYGEDLTDEILFDELADYLSDAVMSPFAEDKVIERCCQALDELCTTPGIDPVRMVYGRVLGDLSPVVLQRLRSYLGPRLEALLDEVEQLDELGELGEPDDIDELLLYEIARLEAPAGRAGRGDDRGRPAV